MREQSQATETHLRLLPSYHDMDLALLTDLNIDFFDEYKRYILELHDHFSKNEINKMNIVLNGSLRQLSNYKDSKLKLNNLLIRLKQKIPNLYDNYLQKLLYDFKTDDSVMINELFERENAIRDDIKTSLAQRVNRLARVLDTSKTYKNEHKLVHCLSYILSVIGFFDQINFNDKFELDSGRIYQMFVDSFIVGISLDLTDLTTLNTQGFDLFQKHRTNTYYGKKEILLDKIIGLIRRTDLNAYKTRGNVLRLLMDGRSKLQRQLNDTTSHLLNTLIDNPIDISHLYRYSDDSYSVDFIQSRIKKFYDFLYFNSENNVFGTSQHHNLRTGPLHGTLLDGNTLNRTLGNTLNKTAPLKIDFRGQDLMQDPEDIAEQLAQPDIDVFTHSTLLGILKDLFYHRINAPYICSLVQAKESYYILYVIERVIKEFISIKTKIKDILIEHKLNFDAHLKDRESVVSNCLLRISQKYSDNVSGSNKLTFESLESKISETFVEMDILLDDLESDKAFYQEPFIPKIVLKARNELNMKKLPGSFELLSRALKINLVNIPFNTTLVKFTSNLHSLKRYNNGEDDYISRISDIYYMFDNLKYNFFRVYYQYDNNEVYDCVTYNENHLDVDDKDKIDFVEASYFKDQTINHHPAIFDEDLDLEYDTKSKCFMVTRYLQLNGFDPSYIIGESVVDDLIEILNSPIVKENPNTHSLYKTEQNFQTVKERLQEINRYDTGTQVQNLGYSTGTKIFNKEKLSEIAKRVQVQKDKPKDTYLDYSSQNVYLSTSGKKNIGQSKSNENSHSKNRQSKNDEKEKLQRLKKEREERELREKEENRRKYEEVQEARRKEEEDRRELARQRREEKERQMREQMEEEKREKQRKDEEKRAKELRDKAEKDEKEKMRLEQLKIEKEERDRKMKEEAEKLKRQKEDDDKIRAEKVQRDREEKEAVLKKQQLEKEMSEKDKKARLEEERKERERLDKERLEKEKLEKERLLREKQEREQNEKDRLERERQEKERLEKERVEIQRLAKEKADKERRDKEEKDRQENEQKEQEKAEREKLERERLDKLEKDRLDKLEKERFERDRIDKERQEKEIQEKNRSEKEHLEKERLEKERLEKEKAERERLDKERQEKIRVDNERKQKEIDMKEPKSKPKADDDESFDFDDDFDDIGEGPPKPPVIQQVKTPVETTPVKVTQDSSVQPKKGGIRGIRELRDNTTKTPESLKNTIKKPSMRKIHLFDIHMIKSEVVANMEENFMTAEEISQYYSSTEFGYTKFIEMFQELITDKCVFFFDVTLGSKIAENYEKDNVS